MDPRVFLLICLAAAFRPQPSVSLGVEVELPTGPKHVFNETDFQRLRDDVNSGDSDRMEDIALAEAWPSFLKAHPEEGWRLFKKLATDERWKVKCQAARSPAWPMLLETHNAEAWHLFEQLATTDDMIVRMAAFESPAWPMLLETHKAEAARLFQKLATTDHDEEVWAGATKSPAWPMLLETDNAEAWQLFQKLAQDKESALVREAVATSPAWPMLLETHNAEAARLFEKLATDENEYVRKAAAMSSAWPDLVRSNWWESWRVLTKLMSDQELRHEVYLPDSTAWVAFRAVPRAAVEEHLDSFTPTNLQEMAMSAQKVADNGFTPNVKDLPVVKGLGTRLQRSANETWLGKMAEMPLFAGNAAQRVSPAQNV